MNNLWQYIIPGVFAVIVAIIELVANKDRKRTKQLTEEIERKNALREEESRCSMQMMYATLQLSIVTANALTGGHNNGNVEQAKLAAQTAEADYQKFLQKVAASAINK